MTSYERVKDHVFTNLQKQGDPSAYKIHCEIMSAKTLMESLGETLFAHALPDKTKLDPLSDADWEQMQEELEDCFALTQDTATIVACFIAFAPFKRKKE
jgi:hypothetical protein